MSPAPTVTLLSVAKAGNADDENEDFADFLVGDAGVDIAVSDGATEAAFSRQWARTIVRHWITSPAPGVSGVLDAARGDWLQAIPAREDLPWFGQAKFDEGSAATFLG